MLAAHEYTFMAIKKASATLHLNILAESVFSQYNMTSTEVNANSSFLFEPSSTFHSLILTAM